MEAQWVKMYFIIHYGYKNNICIDFEHGLISRYAVTPANINDSHMLPMLIDPENIDDYVWADTAYAGECFQNLLILGGFESCIHEKGGRYHPLGDAAKELNSIKSAVTACDQHFFGCMTMSMGGKIPRKIGLGKNKAFWGLKNLTFLRYLPRADRGLTLA